MAIKNHVTRTLTALLAAASIASFSGCANETPPAQPINFSQIQTVQYDSLTIQPQKYTETDIGYNGKITNLHFSQAPYTENITTGLELTKIIVDMDIESDAGVVPAKNILTVENNDAYFAIQMKLQSLVRNETKVRAVGKLRDGYLLVDWIEKNDQVYLNLTNRDIASERITGQGTIEDLIYTPGTGGDHPIPDETIVQLKVDNGGEIKILYKGLNLDAQKIAQLNGKLVSYTAQRGVLNEVSSEFYHGIELK